MRVRRTHARRRVEPTSWWRQQIFRDHLAAGQTNEQLFLPSADAGSTYLDQRWTVLRVKIDFSPWLIDEGNIAWGSTPVYLPIGVCVASTTDGGGGGSINMDPGVDPTRDWMFKATWTPDISPGAIADTLPFGNYHQVIDIKAKRKMKETDVLYFCWDLYSGNPASGSKATSLLSYTLNSSVLFQRTLK